ncbi:MAG: hypothetical protein H2056_07135 [Sphingopyxis sp.]|nr:hypothetical protein [Sphingopyxis sp.]
MLPPPRYRIVERQGRLEVIDSETGGRPPTAAERMAAHDAAHGHAALRYDRLAETAAASEAPVPSAPPVSQSDRAPEPAARPAPTNAIRAAIAQRANPWGDGNGGRVGLGAQSQSEAQARPGPGANQGTARRTLRSRIPRDENRMPMVTSKWWDSKGPRTLDLGEAGRAKLSGGFVTAAIVAFFALIAMAIAQPALILVAGFALFRFGGTIIGPIGARLIDEAIKADR